MSHQSLESRTDLALIEGLKSLRKVERHSCADILLHLGEVDKRQLYRDAGYPSLYAFCTKELRYSEGGAQRRIQAARLIVKHPEFYEKVRDGEINLCALADLSRVCNEENKVELIEASVGRPREEVQRVVAAYLPPQKRSKKSTVTVKRVIVDDAPLFAAAAETQEEYTFTIRGDREVKELYDEARASVGGNDPAFIFKLGLLALKAQREKKVAPTVRKPSSKPINFTRYVRKSVKDEVRARDKGQCTYVAPDGTRCCERHRLEFDHIRTIANGGLSEPSNLRLRCGPHNRLHAEQCFGKEFMLKHRHSGGGVVRSRAEV